MSLPFFYTESIAAPGNTIVLDEETSRHIIGVLRMEAGERLHLTDGNGNLLTAVIVNDHKKKCSVVVEHAQSIASSSQKITIAISLLKNNSRFEWFLEKATEIGVTKIIPLLCERTERQHFRYDRMKAVLVSAMLQSQQNWLPVLSEPIKFHSFIEDTDKESIDQKFVAHCVEERKSHLSDLVRSSSSQIILIGPEGDFTNEEIQLALQHQFIPVSLGNTRLRTETAGVVAAALMKK